MSIQEDKMWESDSHCHPVVRRMALYHLSSLKSPGVALVQQSVRDDAGEAEQKTQVQGFASS